MSHPIRHLRNVQLDPKLALQLSDIVSAYRPHDAPPERALLGERLPLESPLSMSNLCKDINIDYKARRKSTS